MRPVNTEFPGYGPLYGGERSYIASDGTKMTVVYTHPKFIEAAERYMAEQKAKHDSQPKKPRRWWQKLIVKR